MLARHCSCVLPAQGQPARVIPYKCRLLVNLKIKDLPIVHNIPCQA